MDIKNNKLIKIAGYVVQTALILMLVLLAVFSFGTRLPLLSQRGLNFFAVTSGSMEPTIPAGALIYTGKYQLEELSKGDIITFQLKDSQSGEVSVVTHRINKVLKEEETKTYEADGEEKEKKVVTYEFVTKGDANNTPDSRTVPAGNIIGKYQWHLPRVGYVTTFAQTQQGFLLLVVLPALILIVWELVSLISYIKEHYENKAKEEIEKIKQEMEKEKKDE
jgi:signal peptidase